MRLKGIYNLNRSKLRMSRNKYNLRIYYKCIRSLDVMKYRNERFIMISRLKSLVYPCRVNKVFGSGSKWLLLRLRYVLYVGGFGVSLRHCDYLIFNRLIKVNRIKIGNKGYVCKLGDVIQIDSKALQGEKIKAEWLSLPYYLSVNRALGMLIVSDVFKDSNYLFNKVRNRFYS